MEDDPDCKPEGGAVADEYAERLNTIENQIEEYRIKIRSLNDSDYIHIELPEIVPASLLTLKKYRS